jgi:REP-associated tyrosine transposase
MRRQRPRLPTPAYREGLACLLTFCTAGRRRVFQDPDLVALVTCQILLAADREGVSVSAYCFMPDHVHLVVEPKAEQADVTHFVRRAKQLAGYYFRRRTGTALWQPSWHDRVLRRADDVLDAIRYVVNNPIRAGLVDDIAKYPFVGSGSVSRAALMSSLDGQA